MEVSIREFKSHFSQYLRQAQAGRPLTITSHRKPVARVVGVPTESDEATARLIASGVAAWSGGKPSGASIRLSAEGTAVSQMVLDDRG